MKSLFYSLLVVVSFSLISCEKQDYSERDRLSDYQSLDKKEGDDEEDFLIGISVLNLNNIPISGAVIHAINNTNNQCSGVSTSDSFGNCQISASQEEYYFEVYENGVLTHTSGLFYITNGMNITLRY